MTTSKRPCPTCHQVVETKIGLNSDNMKKLFKKPTMQDYITLLMLVLILVLAYAYNIETEVCRETLIDLRERGLLDQYYPTTNIDLNVTNQACSIAGEVEK